MVALVDNEESKDDASEDDSANGGDGGDDDDDEIRGMVLVMIGVEEAVVALVAVIS
jgi:hypothetical protein